MYLGRGVHCRDDAVMQKQKMFRSVYAHAHTSARASSVLIGQCSTEVMWNLGHM